MRIIGLTGGIAMGKSTIAAAFRRAHIPVFDADRTVHALQAAGGRAVPAIARAFPGAVAHGQVDRPALRAAVLGHPERLRLLEAILHPMVAAARARFIARHRRAGARLVVLDIPLLFETGADRGVDLTVVVTAPAAIQLQRLRRRRLPEPQIRAILARQMPDAPRRACADVLIRTGLSRHHAQRRLRRLLVALR